MEKFPIRNVRPPRLMVLQSNPPKPVLGLLNPMVVEEKIDVWPDAYLSDVGLLMSFEKRTHLIHGLPS